MAGGLWRVLCCALLLVLLSQGQVTRQSDLAILGFVDTDLQLGFVGGEVVVHLTPALFGWTEEFVIILLGDGLDLPNAEQVGALAVSSALATNATVSIPDGTVATNYTHIMAVAISSSTGTESVVATFPLVDRSVRMATTPTLVVGEDTNQLGTYFSGSLTISINVSAPFNASTTEFETTTFDALIVCLSTPSTILTTNDISTKYGISMPNNSFDQSPACFSSTTNNTIVGNVSAIPFNSTRLTCQTAGNSEVSACSVKLTARDVPVASHTHFIAYHVTALTVTDYGLRDSTIEFEGGQIAYTSIPIGLHNTNADYDFLSDVAENTHSPWSGDGYGPEVQTMVDTGMTLLLWHLPETPYPFSSLLQRVFLTAPTYPTWDSLLADNTTCSLPYASSQSTDSLTLNFDQLSACGLVLTESNVLEGQFSHIVVNKDDNNTVAFQFTVALTVTFVDETHATAGAILSSTLSTTAGASLSASVDTESELNLYSTGFFKQLTTNHSSTASVTTLYVGSEVYLEHKLLQNTEFMMQMYRVYLQHLDSTSQDGLGLVESELATEMTNADMPQLPGRFRLVASVPMVINCESDCRMVAQSTLYSTSKSLASAHSNCGKGGCATEASVLISVQVPPSIGSQAHHTSKRTSITLTLAALIAARIFA